MYKSRNVFCIAIGLLSSFACLAENYGIDWESYRGAVMSSHYNESITKAPGWVENLEARQAYEAVLGDGISLKDFDADYSNPYIRTLDQWVAYAGGYRDSITLTNVYDVFVLLQYAPHITSGLFKKYVDATIATIEALDADVLLRHLEYSDYDNRLRVKDIVPPNITRQVSEQMVTSSRKVILQYFVSGIDTLLTLAHATSVHDSVATFAIQTFNERVPFYSFVSKLNASNEYATEATHLYSSLAKAIPIEKITTQHNSAYFRLGEALAGVTVDPAQGDRLLWTIQYIQKRIFYEQPDDTASTSLDESTLERVFHYTSILERLDVTK